MKRYPVIYPCDVHEPWTAKTVQNILCNRAVHISKGFLALDRRFLCQLLTDISENVL